MIVCLYAIKGQIYDCAIDSYTMSIFPSLEYKETIMHVVAITEKRDKTLGLEGTDRIYGRISNDDGNGPAGMAAVQAQERP